MTMSKSPSRRTVVAGAAWAVPAVAFASQAPALAVSRKCLTLPRFSRWQLDNKDVNEKPFRLERDTLTAIIDWAWWTGNVRPDFGYGWARTRLRVEPGNRYTIYFGLATCKGYNWPGSGSPESCETNNTTLEVIWTPFRGTEQVIFKAATQETDDYALYEPPVNCTGAVENRKPLWKQFPDKAVSFEVPCGSPRSGTLELRFTAYPHQRVVEPGGPGNATSERFSNQNNDDWRVTPKLVTCVPIGNC